MKGFEAEHLPCYALDEPMVLLKDIVQLVDLQDFNGLPCSCELQDDIHGFQTRKIGPTFVDDDAVGDAIRSNCPPEEAPRRSFVTMLRQHEIKGLTVPVYGAIVIHPLSAHLDIGLIHAP